MSEPTFADRMLRIKNEAFTALGVSMGLRLRLFETLGSLGRPITHRELATHAGCKERYIQQWLGLMVCSGIIEVSKEEEDGEERYYIPIERLPHLSADTGGQAAVWLYGFPVFSSIQRQLEDCFKTEGPQGIPYKPYEELIEVRGKLFVGDFWPNLMTQVVGNTPNMATRLEKGGTFLEIGCGDGEFIRKFAQKYPNSHFSGIDLWSSAIQVSCSKSAEVEISNVSFAEHDGQNLPSDWSEKFDYVITVKVIHDATKPKQMLQEMKRVLKPDGVAYAIDLPLRREISENIQSPLANTLYTAGLFHCIPSSMYYGGPGLGPCWGVENMQEMLTSAGFSVDTITDDRLAHYICTKNCD